MLTRRRFGGVAALLVGAGALGAVSRSVAVAAESVDVAMAAEAYRKAMVAADGNALGQLAAEELSFGHSNGLVQTKREFIDSVVTKQEIFRSIEHKDRRSYAVGDTGVVRYTFVADILLNGAPLLVSLGVVETWNRMDGGWKLVARQAYKT